MAKQIIPFIDPFKLIIDTEQNLEQLTEDGLRSIGVLSSIAKDCADLVATHREGGEPTELMLTQVLLGASVLSGLSLNISQLLMPDELSG